MPGALLAQSFQSRASLNAPRVAHDGLDNNGGNTIRVRCSVAHRLDTAVR